MNLSSIEVALRGLQHELNSVDTPALSGANASRLIQVMARSKHALDAALLSTSAHAVAVNQHNVDGARSGAAWVAEKTGVSERQARSDLLTHKRLQDLPYVEDALKSGEISLQKAAAVARGADGSDTAAQELLDVARRGTVEMIERRAQEIQAQGSNSSKRERQRKSQFVNVHTGESMVTGEFRLLPENAVALITADRAAQGDSSWERAESFAKQLSSSGKRQTQVIFHLDLNDGGRCELKGFGPVARQAAMNALAIASTALVGTIDNKLAWFSERDRRSTTALLPEYVKRAVLAYSYHRCDLPNCVGSGEQVDHIKARCNNGINDVENLQSLCEPDHHAKTKVDAPWTAGGIYGKKRKLEGKFEDTG